MSVDRVAAFEADIAASPGALSRRLAGWRAVVDLGERPIVLTGLGSSRSAATIVATALRRTGRTAWDAHPVEVAAIPPDARRQLAVVAISASGRTPEVVAAAERHRASGLVVAVTNAPDSPLARAAEAVLPLDAGDEASGIACRTFRATLLVLGLVTGLATVDGLRLLVASMVERLRWLETSVTSLAAGLDGAPAVDVLADAALVGLAEQAALMVREAPRLPAHAFETAEWLHTGVYLALPGHRVVLFEGSPADEEVVDTVERRGGTVMRLPADPAIPDPLGRAIVDSVIAERVAAVLWRRAGAVDKAP